MSTIRTLILLGLLSTAAMAEVNPLNASALPGITAGGAGVAATATLPDMPLSEQKRPFALALGIALVLATFHRALKRQRA